MIKPLSVPDFMKEHCQELMKKVITEGSVDKETWGITLKNSLPRELRITKVYLWLISEVDELLDNLNIVIEDIRKLPTLPDISRSNQFKKYLLLTRLYFYEVARLEDIFSRFLSGMQSLGFLTKKDRKEMKSMFYEQIEMSIMIRNSMAHGSFEWGNKDREIQFMSTLDKKGFEPKLVPKDGGEHIEFDKDIRAACFKRADAFLKHGQDIENTMTTYVSISARWLQLHGHFYGDLSKKVEFNKSSKPDAK